MFRRQNYYLLSALLSSSILFLKPAIAQTWISPIAVVTTQNSATLTWTTAVPSDTQVKYGTGSTYGKRSVLNSSLVTAHSVTLTGLTAGPQYHARALAQDSAGVLVTSLDYSFATQAGPVTVSVSPTSATVDSSATQQFTAQVSNSSNTAVTWSTTAGSVSSSGLFTAPAVTTDKSVTITAVSVADPTKSATAAVAVKAPAPVLAVSPSGLTFSAQQGGSNPPSAQLSVSNTGGGTLTFSVSRDASWLTVSPLSGAAPAKLQVSASIAGLAVGTYTGHVNVTASGAKGSPASIPVVLTITPPPAPHLVSLTWNASTSSGVVGYNAYRGMAAGGPYALAASALPSSSYVDSTVQSGLTYYYVVTAVDSGGQESVYSNEAKASVP